MKVFQVPEQVFQAVANYMATRPYQEVNQLMNAMFTTTRIVEIPDEPPAPPSAPVAEKPADEAKA